MPIGDLGGAVKQLGLMLWGESHGMNSENIESPKKLPDKNPWIQAAHCLR